MTGRPITNHDQKTMGVDHGPRAFEGICIEQTGFMMPKKRLELSDPSSILRAELKRQTNAVE